jgi:cytoskeletal protein RodZ
MRILTVEEIPTGADQVMSAQFSRRRRNLGVSIADVADATGADIRELALIESGQLAAFADPERLRLVVLAYCDYLGLEPGPVLSRLEAYADWAFLNPPHQFAPYESDDLRFAARPSLSFMVFGLGIVFLAGWVVLHAVAP